MATLYLMRHGQTYFNIWHKIQGWCDSPLTPDGIKQAKKAHEYFQENKITFSKAYSSTSERACDTLEIAAGMSQHDYYRLKELKEQNFGSFEAHDECLNPPIPYGNFFVRYGGESEKAVQKRMYVIISEIIENIPERGNALVVSHAGAIFNFFKAAGFDMDEIFASNFSNCSIAKISYDNNKFKLEKIINPAEVKTAA